jgi:hypothetical protein
MIPQLTRGAFIINDYLRNPHFGAHSHFLARKSSGADFVCENVDGRNCY